MPFNVARTLPPVFLSVPLRSTWRALMLAGLAASGLAGCSVMVKANNAPQAAPSYYLRGRNLQALHVEAARLCSSGYVATREWQGYEGPDHGGLFKNGLALVIDWFAPPAFDEAQMDVQCKATPVAPAASIKPPSTETLPQS